MSDSLAPISADWACAWLDHMGYPQPVPGQPVLIFAEGTIPRFETAQGGRHWPSPAPGDWGDLWEGIGSEFVGLEVVPNDLDQFNEAGLLLWVGGGMIHIGVFFGSVNPGSVLSSRKGWPQLGDGAHLYFRSGFLKKDEHDRVVYENGQAVIDKDRPALRSHSNRCGREIPVVEGVGGDLELTLTELITRGLGVNSAILVHPGRKPTFSAGCPLTSGTKDDVVWLAIWGHTGERGIWVIRHNGIDLSRWVRSGGATHVPPLMRPGCNAHRWMVPVQRALGVTPDGVFGPLTAAALLQARLARGLERASAEHQAINHGDWSALGLPFVRPS